MEIKILKIQMVMPKQRGVFFKIVLLSQNILTTNTFHLKRQDGYKDAAPMFAIITFPYNLESLIVILFTSINF